MARWRGWLAAVLLVGLSVAVYRHRADAALALRDVAAMSTAWKLTLLALTAGGIATSGLAVRTVTPGLSISNAVMVHQATTAANNAVIGSGPVNLGLRVAMLRSWGVSGPAIALTVVALNVVAAYKTWLVTLVVAVLGLSGSARGVIDHRIFVVAAIVAVAVIVGSTTWWWMVLTFPVLSGWIARRCQRLTHRVRRRVPRLPPVDIPSVTESLRHEARRLVRHCGSKIVTATTLEQVLFVLTPVAVVRAVGIDASVISTAEVIIAFGLVRLAAALTPIPGGIGITEIALVTLLIRFGGPEPAVVAAVLTYRSITFLLPLATGGACLAVWRWRGRQQTSSPLATVPPEALVRARRPDAVVEPAG